MKKSIGLMKNKSDGKIIKDFVGLIAETSSYLTYDEDESKKAKGTKTHVIKRKLRFEDYKICLKATLLERK